MKTIRALALVTLVLALTTLSFGPQEARVLRFPTVSNDAIVFSYAGDLYTVPLAGGVARKLTAYYEGYEAFARFSPDGASIAFTGEYDGNREVYLIPAGGGVPKRLTYTPTLGRDDISDRMGPNNLVMGWTHDGEPDRLPLAHGRMERFQRPALSGLEGRRDAGRAAAAARRVLLLFAGRHEARLQPDLPRVPDLEALPRRHGRRHLDLRLRRQDGREHHLQPGPRHHPHVERRPDLLPVRPGRGQADEPLRLRPRLQGDAQADELRRVRHQVPLARPQAHRLRERRLSLHASTWPPSRRPACPSSSPTTMVSGAGQGRQGRQPRQPLRDRPRRPAGPVRRPRRRLHRARQERQHPEPDRDPRRPRAQSQVVARRPDRSPSSPTAAAPRRSGSWTRTGRASRVSSRPAATPTSTSSAGRPTGRRSSGTTRCSAWPSSTSRPRRSRSRPRPRPARSTNSPGRPTAAGSPTASPRSRARPGSTSTRVDSQKTFAVTDAWYNSGDPAFSDDGKYLFFVSDRDFDPVYSSTEWNHAYLAMSRVYFVTLSKDVKSPFAPKSDEVAVKAEKPAAPAAKAPAGRQEARREEGARRPARQGGHRRPHGPHRRPAHRDGQLRPDLRRRRLRLLRQGEVPRAAARPDALRPGRSQGNGPRARSSGYEVSADGKKMLVQKDGAYGIIDLPQGADQAR